MVDLQSGIIEALDQHDCQQNSAIVFNKPFGGKNSCIAVIIIEILEVDKDGDFNPVVGFTKENNLDSIKQNCQFSTVGQRTAFACYYGDKFTDSFGKVIEGMEFV